MMRVSPGPGAVALPRAGARFEDYLLLTKPRVVPLILVTTAAGYYLGSTGSPDLVRLLLTLAGTGLAAAGSLALNQLAELDLDRRMRRTRDRPLPKGRLGPSEALVFGATLVILGLLVLSLLASALAGAVTALTVASYLFAYTPLKRRSALCTLVGAVPGALPPVAGWAAARGDLGPGAGALFGILFFWQLPHALAVARLYRDDYAAAGIVVLPVVDPSGRATARQVVLNSLALLAVGMLPTLVGVAGPAYLAGSLVLGLVLLALGLRLGRDDSERAARRLFRYSLVYVPALLALLVLDKV